MKRKLPRNVKKIIRIRRKAKYNRVINERMLKKIAGNKRLEKPDLDEIMENATK